MKKGDIVKNNWAGDGNPTKIFIYTGLADKYGYGIYLDGGSWRKTRFFRSDLRKYPEIYQVIGHSEGWELMKKELKEISNEKSKYQKEHDKYDFSEDDEDELFRWDGLD